MIVAFATCSQFAGLTEDDRLALPHLAAGGVEVVPYVWDTEMPTGVGAVVVRSCWDYHEKTEPFSRWLEKPPARMMNPASVLRWNLNKTYLEDLRAWGFDVPRTVWVEAGSQVALESLLESAGLDEAVVKPVVGMNGFDTWRTSLAQAASHQARLEELTRQRGVMIQEFVPEVLTGGETSLLFYGGQFSHAVCKRAAPGEFRIHEEWGGRRETITPHPALVEEAGRILAHFTEPLLYARVDGVVTDGRFMLMEVELIDPALFLAFDPSAPRRFASAILNSI